MTSKHETISIYLSPSSGSTDLAPIAANYFIHLNNGAYATMNLPDVGVMAGQSLTFITTNSSYESSLSLSGPIWLSDSSFDLTSPVSVTLLSDGNRWWVTNYFTGP